MLLFVFKNQHIQAGFDFTINNPVLRKENISVLLKPKAGLHLLTENNVLTDKCKSVIETVLPSI
jgi:hypothetical protein